MAGSFTDYYKIIKPNSSKDAYVPINMSALQQNSVGWYQKVMKGATSRFQQYQNVENMDGDVFVARALDTIAEEMASISSDTKLPFEIEYQNEIDTEVNETLISTLRAALRYWVNFHNFDDNIFDICRHVIKYGDAFFKKSSDHKRWEYVSPKSILGVIMDDNNEVQYYQLRFGSGKIGSYTDIQLIPAKAMVHFSLSTGMDSNFPFGMSVLTPSIKAFRHLSLLEDAVIIYRIVRAPERRVFTIDTGNMPPQRARAYLESVKTEFRQKRAPSADQQNGVDSGYDAMAITEDIFLTKSSEGRGSTIDTLAGGESLGEINDLVYFQNRLLQGLRIPASYMRGSAENGYQVQDGKVGMAYIEELRFANFVSRLQQKLSSTFEMHFKMFLKSANIRINHDLFKIRLPEPQNFKAYRESELNQSLINNFNSIKDTKFISPRFAMRKYLNLSEEDIQLNEALLKQERDISDDPINEHVNDLRLMYDPAWLDNMTAIELGDKFNKFDVTGESSSGEGDNESGDSEELPTPPDFESGSDGESTGETYNPEDGSTTPVTPDNTDAAEETPEEPETAANKES